MYTCLLGTATLNFETYVAAPMEESSWIQTFALKRCIDACGGEHDRKGLRPIGG